MRSGLGSLRRALLVPISAALIASCTVERAVDPTCVRMEGAWDAQITPGSLVAEQTWTFSQAGCELAVSAYPGDSAGLALPATGAGGSAWTDGFMVAWTFDNGPCRYSGKLVATVTGNTLAGTVDSFRAAHQAGYCAGAGSWSFPAAATRP